MRATLDFTQARFKHINWKFRIRNFLDGKETLPKEKAVSHHECDLGKWFETTGKEKYGHMAEMKEFDVAHKELHNVIRKIVDLKENNNDKEAELEYKNILTLSDTIVRLLNETESKVNGSPVGV